jgi:flagellar assembly protein FliH
MSSSAAYINPVTTLEYSDMAHLGASALDVPTSEISSMDAEAERGEQIVLSEEQFAQRIQSERADARQQTEQRLRQDYEAQLQAARASIAAAIAAFAERQTDYYARAEAEIVQLALSIAAKVLHREAQVDPMLVAALVRMTLEKMHEGSAVAVRIHPTRAKQWKEYFASHKLDTRVEVVEDPALANHDCLLETELGTANFGLDAQLKEIEKGFFDLLALRPQTR